MLILRQILRKLLYNISIIFPFIYANLFNPPLPFAQKCIIPPPSLLFFISHIHSRISVPPLSSPNIPIVLKGRYYISPSNINVMNARISSVHSFIEWVKWRNNWNEKYRGRGKSILVWFWLVRWVGANANLFRISGREKGPNGMDECIEWASQKC